MMINAPPNMDMNIGNYLHKWRARTYGDMYNDKDFVIPDYRGMADRSDISSYMWPDSEIHGSSTSPASNPIPAHSHSQIDHGFSRSVNAAAAAIAANSQHGPGPGIQSNPLYSPPGTSSSSPAASSHLSRHHDLLPGGSLGSNTLNSPPTSTAAAAAVALAISAASNPPTSPLIVPQPLKMARPPKTYHCRMCDQMFECKSDMMMHSQQIHKQDPKPYKCELCPKSFANSSYLSQHNRIHAGIKPYKCQICERKFTQLCHLQQHLRTHTGEKPYRCQHPGCPKAFSQLGNLQSHSRSHMTDKPYRCNSCYKCFTTEQGLREHIPKHSETKHLKTHICQICGKSYTQETYLSRHMQKHQSGPKDHHQQNRLALPPLPSKHMMHGGMDPNHHSAIGDVLQAHHQQQQHSQHQSQQQSPHMQLPTMLDHTPLNLNQNHHSHHHSLPSSAHSSADLSFEKTIRDSLMTGSTDNSKMSAFAAPLAHQLSGGSMMNTGMHPNLSFPPAAHLTTTPIQHLSSLGSSRYFFEGMGLGNKRDSIDRPPVGHLDRPPVGHLDRSPLDRSPLDRSPLDRPLDMAREMASRESPIGNNSYLHLQQIRQYKPPTAAPVFPKHEPSSPLDKDLHM